ncbi:centrosomal protein of 131 kDa-like [Homalodisca vitripennis]|uniref:centrosomal protein of 131 kDa-like n=1 Tax=Homalodisca vitripennis TaxID=197043 RepID=UPI001EEC0E8F|nr:centrosomal protein of 131 kDa-like [Homalodisca vitripennis]
MIARTDDASSWRFSGCIEIQFRLEQELCQVEKSYQEQRRRLLEEVRQEKELLQRQNERILAEKQTELAKQVDEAKQKLQLKLADYEKKHQEELAKMKECLETEKQAWITRQKGGLEEREAALREELKRERDRHTELVIRRLESEAATKEQAIENKIKIDNVIVCWVPGHEGVCRNERVDALANLGSVSNMMAPNHSG